jgi:hypothetical protein
LSLHFSDFSVIFYAIYKNKQTHFTILVALLQGGPRKEKFPCNVAPGAVAGAGWPNSGDAPPDSSRGGQGKDLRFTGARFRGLDGDEATPAVGCTGGQRHWPPRLAQPARGASGGG